MSEKKSEKFEISWRAAERDHFEKTPLWFASVGGATIILIVFAFMSKNFFFAVFVALAGIMIMFFGKNRPQIFNFKLTEEGMAVGDNKFYPFEKLESFSFRNRPGRLDELVLKKKENINPYVRIPIDSKLAEKVKTKLLEKITEFQYNDSLIDVFGEWLGF